MDIHAVLPHVPKTRIVIVGAGRFASALARTLRDSVVGVAARNLSTATTVAALANDGARAVIIDNITTLDFEILWITSADIAIQDLAIQLAESRSEWDRVTVVHSSGALPLSVLEPFRSRGAAIAALHPNASLTGGEEIQHDVVWSFEGDGIGEEFVQDLLSEIRPRVVSISSALRPLYHAAASVAGNYTVTVFQMAVELYCRAGLSPEDATRVVASFMNTAVERSQHNDTRQVITGPVVRGDWDVVRGHLDALETYAQEFTESYSALGQTTAGLFLDGGTDEWNREIHV